MNEYFIGPDREGERLDRFLAEQMADKSRSYLQRLIKEQEITVNGKPVKAGYRLFSDDRITVNLPDAKEPDIVPEDIPLDILYEDEDLIIINKPKQMVVHPAWALQWYACQRINVSLWFRIVWHQWNDAAWNRSPD